MRDAILARSSPCMAWLEEEPWLSFASIARMLRGNHSTVFTEEKKHLHSAIPGEAVLRLLLPRIVPCSVVDMRFRRCLSFCHSRRESAFRFAAWNCLGAPYLARCLRQIWETADLSTPLPIPASFACRGPRFRFGRDDKLGVIAKLGFLNPFSSPWAERRPMNTPGRDSPALIEQL